MDQINGMRIMADQTAIQARQELSALASVKKGDNAFDHFQRVIYLSSKGST